MFELVDSESLPLKVEHFVSRLFGIADRPYFNFFEVGCKQRHGGQRGRAYGEALTSSRGSVSESVEKIGALTDFGRHMRHFGVAAGVIGDGAVRVGSEGNAEGRKHADGGEAYAVKAEAEIIESAGKAE